MRRASLAADSWLPGETSSVGAEHLQIVGIQKDPERDLIYRMSIPEIESVVYDIKKGKTTMLGKPN